MMPSDHDAMLEQLLVEYVLERLDALERLGHLVPNPAWQHDFQEAIEQLRSWALDNPEEVIDG